MRGDYVLMRLILVMMMIVCLCGGGIAAQQNPITNGGFENVAEDGVPVDWDLLGSVSVKTDETHSGQRSLHIVRREDAEGITGLNRAWEEGSGQQGAMLDELSGGIEFWYRAVSASAGAKLSVQVIPMDDNPREVGGRRARWFVPEQHIGDGKWHRGRLAYDFSGSDEIRWVHVSARLKGGAGEMWLDDLNWVSGVGPALQAGNARIEEKPGKEGYIGSLLWTLHNVGDSASPAGTAKAAAPEGLKLKPAERQLPPIAAGESKRIDWQIIGERDQIGDVISLSATCGNEKLQESVTLRADARATKLVAPKMLMRRGQQVTVRLYGRNDGNAIGGGLNAKLIVPRSMRGHPIGGKGGLPPGVESEIASWRVTAREPDALAHLRAVVNGEKKISVPMVIAGRLPRHVRTKKGVYAFENEKQAVIGSDRSRLILGPVDPEDEDSWAVGLLQVPDRPRWRTVAVLPRLGLLATENSEKVLSAAHIDAEVTEESAKLYLRGIHTIDGVDWRIFWTLTAKEGRPVIGFTVRAMPREDAAITALEGPMLYAAEMNSQARDDAILPGLEWLVRGERSSSALDIKPDHPDRIRYVPHPKKITIPAAAMRFGNAAVGLLWDIPPAQPSYRAAGPMSVAFASPNRFEGHDNHLMGLFLPGVSHDEEGRVAENERRAAKPLSISAKDRLKIHAGMFAASPVDDSLAAVDLWLKHHGYPKPLEYPRGDVKSEIAFSLKGYFKDRALWNPDWNKWYSDLIVGFNPDAGPARELLRGAQLLQEAPVAERARELAAEVMGGDKRSRKLQLQHRAKPGQINKKRGRIKKYISTQKKDGNWGFTGEDAGEWPEEGVNYDVLGPTGATAVGLTAPKASECLKFALLTGDAEAGEAGIKALDAMRRFTVPRAAQVWEVPVHTPDILASARAVDAYLNGYQLTGGKAYLEEAAYWARAGLPFVYVWHPNEQPAMQGASIPVFGATSYVLSWFGVAVQWNGIAYARSLLRLAEYDDSFPWQHVAENLYRSGMYQQATEGDRLGQWPDAVNFIEGRPGLHGQTPPCFRPSSILKHELRTMGVNVNPKISVVQHGERPLLLRGEANFSKAEWNVKTDNLSFIAEFNAPQRGAVEVIGVRQPERVILDGTRIAQSEDVWSEDTAGWHWHESADNVEIRITESGRHTVQVRDVKRAEVITFKTRRDINFTFDGTAEGWTAANDLTPLRVSDGAIRTENTGGDPYMVRSGLSVAGKASDVLAIRLSATAGGGGAVYFATERGGFSPERRMAFEYTPDGSWQNVNVPIGDHDEWAGHTVTALRIDPMTGEETAEVGIDRVKVH